MEQTLRILSQSASKTVYEASNETGEMLMTEYRVFPGIRLVYRDVHMLRYACPDNDTPGVLEINHCREGRYEHRIGRQYYYLSAGDLSVSCSAGGEAFYPTSHYHGISVVIDPGKAPECLSCVLDDVNVRPSALMEKFLTAQSCFIIRSTESLGHIFSELYTVPESIRMGYLKVKVLELLLFLSSLDTGLSQTQAHTCPQSQVRLAKAVCSYVCADMSRHITIDQLAEHFQVSPTLLKKSFRNVYGDSLYSYVRTQKMLTAARLLQDTDRTILDIAGECGYDNGSKFSKAFREVMGISPRDFRSRKDLPLESVRLERENAFEGSF
ncbi:MAG: helix-turn-helix transcriptional regulator [Oscillospiraceae bacterium]|nr:helix-turn-helix transcriptional regulator [Oscillospiraceae bacterium]